jgi:hypothetical protein
VASNIFCPIGVSFVRHALAFSASATAFPGSAAIASSTITVIWRTRFVRIAYPLKN